MNDMVTTLRDGADVESLAGTVRPDEQDRVMRSILHTIQDSLIEHPLRHGTKSEIRDRFNICVRAYRMMLFELQWSMPRALAALPESLRQELNAVTLNPSGQQRKMFARPQRLTPKLEIP